MGRMEAAVFTEYGHLQESNLLTFERMRRLASVMDCDTYRSDLSKNDARMESLCEKLRGPKKKTGGRGNRLMDVSTMARKRRQA
ncbi:hypothetical protein Mycch_2662 [Mycolicibacterium chubuense NBB4]|uniref:Uncharacterized protein n=1 Tax=Mycolicibacterium chubuense (strain NBB4) TaxID=710421 RepID=I4BJH2_MYCCN|nr:hypothetical protein Mycch_2662 [Mycolicibacterium chubuense NBB4]